MADTEMQGGARVDALSPIQYLILEVLAARHRSGKRVWTFPARLRPALRALDEAEGLVAWKAGIEHGTVLAWLTDAGRAAVLSDSYAPPTPLATHYPGDGQEAEAEPTTPGNTDWDLRLVELGPTAPTSLEEAAVRLLRADRDRCAAWADRLAYAVGTVDEIGQHSNLNDPWVNALALQQRRQAAARALLGAADEMVNFLLNNPGEPCRWYPGWRRAVDGARSELNIPRDDAPATDRRALLRQTTQDTQDAGTYDPPGEEHRG